MLKGSQVWYRLSQNRSGFWLVCTLLAMYYPCNRHRSLGLDFLLSMSCYWWEERTAKTQRGQSSLRWLGRIVWLTEAQRSRWTFIALFAGCGWFSVYGSIFSLAR